MDRMYRLLRRRVATPHLKLASDNQRHTSGTVSSFSGATTHDENGYDACPLNPKWAVGASLHSDFPV